MKTPFLIAPLAPGRVLQRPLSHGERRVPRGYPCVRGESGRRGGTKFQRSDRADRCQPLRRPSPTPATAPVVLPVGFPREDSPPPLPPLEGPLFTPAMGRGGDKKYTREPPHGRMLTMGTGSRIPQPLRRVGLHIYRGGLS